MGRAIDWLSGTRERVSTSPRAIDVVNSTGMFTAGLVVLALGDTGFLPFGFDIGHWWHVLPLMLGCGLALVRRRLPVVSFAGGLAAVALDLVLAGSTAIIVVLFDLLYNATYWGPRPIRRVALAMSAVAAVLVASGAASATGDARTFLLTLLQAVAVLGTPIWWATNLRQKSELAELAEQRLALEQARSADLQLIAELDRHEAVQAERSKMASDLHDAIASRLSAIALHSAAALTHDPASGRDRTALESVRSSSVAALDDMRSMITVLRQGGPQTSDDASPTASLSAIAELVEIAEASGVTVTIDGTIPDDLAASLDRAIYRIVQESITNAVKHAPGSDVRLTFERSDESFTVTVENPLVAGAPPLDESLSSGIGLTIMRERAEAFRGAFSVGPDADGTRWTVRAEFPLADAGTPVGSDRTEGAAR